MIVSEYVTIDGKSYVTAENYDKVLYKLKAVNEKIYELEQQGKELEERGETLMDIKCEQDDAKAAYKIACAENEELSHKLEKVEAANRELREKVEWYKGQIEAYQYCMNCRR